MNEVMTLTSKGRRLLKSGKLNSPLHELMLVVFDKIDDDIVPENMVSMVSQLVALFGTPEAAIDAINSGQIGFGKAN